MLTIELNDLRFYAFHGLHEEENKIGGDFSVDVEINYLSQNFPIKNIDETVDYTSIYQLVKDIMSHTEPLLETVAGKIAASIFNNFSHVQSATVTIKKINPPIIAFEGHVAVKYALTRDELS